MVSENSWFDYESVTSHLKDTFVDVPFPSGNTLYHSKNGLHFRLVTSQSPAFYRSSKKNMLKLIKRLNKNKETLYIVYPERSIFPFGGISKEDKIFESSNSDTDFNYGLYVETFHFEKLMTRIEYDSIEQGYIILPESGSWFLTSNYSENSTNAGIHILFKERKLRNSFLKRLPAKIKRTLKKKPHLQDKLWLVNFSKSL